MSEKDISRIMVGKHSVSITGMKEAISHFADLLRDRNDQEIGEALVGELEKNNYIPSPARDAYRKAFAREFRKALGQPCTDEEPEGLDIKVLGGGCGQCDRLVQLVMETLTDLDTPGSVEHVMDMKEIARYRVMGVPALIINGRQLWVGSVPSKGKLKSLIQDAISSKS
ncbi:MAG: thioredoxin family protein [Syntrophobacter sp.]